MSIEKYCFLKNQSDPLYSLLTIVHGNYYLRVYVIGTCTILICVVDLSVSFTRAVSSVLHVCGYVILTHKEMAENE